MERAARLFKNKQVTREIMTDEDIARAAWPLAVGKAIARHTSRLKLVRTTLIIEVEDSIWQKQLHCLSRQILGRLRNFTGICEITDLEFRVGVPRRTAQRIEQIDADPYAKTGVTSNGDESEGILDPVLKKVFRLSRKKATA